MSSLVKLKEGKLLVRSLMDSLWEGRKAARDMRTRETKMMMSRGFPRDSRVVILRPQAAVVGAGPKERFYRRNEFYHSVWVYKDVFGHVKRRVYSVDTGHLRPVTCKG